MEVGCGPCVVLEQWLCVIESWSVIGSRLVAVYLWILFRELSKINGCMVLNRGPCLVQDQ
jgi:hypothetical protein